jgi:hypothetical protein
MVFRVNLRGKNMLSNTNSIVASLFVGFVLIATVGIWFLCLSHVSKLTSLLNAMIAASAQIIIEVYLTILPSPFRLHNIPYIHALVLMCLVLLRLTTVKENVRKKNSETVPINSSLLNKEINFVFFTGKLSYIFVFLASMLALVGFYPALLGGPSTVDERAYHWPQILGIVQSDKFSSFDSSLPWTYAYPLGKAASAAFTWPWVTSDLAFRVPQILFGSILILSVYVLGSIRSKKVGILAALLTLASPIFAVLLRMSSDDLGYGAFTLASICLLLKLSTTKNESSEKNFYFAILSFIIAGQFKYPVVSFILVFPLIAFNIIKAQTHSKILIKYRFVSGIGILLSFIYPIRNFFIYGNPFYPMTVSLFGIPIFEGPLTEINIGTVRPSTTFNIEEPFRTIKILSATFFDWFQLPNEDSLGSYNFLTSLLVVSLFIFIFLNIRNIDTPNKILLASIILVLVVNPIAVLPRYGYFLVAIILVEALLTVRKFVEKPIYFVSLILIGIAGFFPILNQNSLTKNWIYSQLGTTNAFVNGQSIIEQRFNLAEDGGVPLANTVTWIKQNVKSKELLCYASATRYPSLYWNDARTSKVKFSPILESDRYPNHDNMVTIYSQKQLDAWIESNINCDYLVVYKTNNALLMNSTQFKLVDIDKNLLILERL